MKRTTRAWNSMRWSYGVILVLAGLDKLFGTDLIVTWAQYISLPVLSVVQSLPGGVPMFLGLMGVVEIAVGILLFTKWAHIAGYLAVAWLVIIAINLLMLNLKDIAIRDLLLAVGAYAIAELTLVELRSTERLAHG